MRISTLYSRVRRRNPWELNSILNKSRDWFWFYFWLDDKVVPERSYNQLQSYFRHRSKILLLNPLPWSQNSGIDDLLCLRCRSVTLVPALWMDRSWQSLFRNCWRKMILRVFSFIYYKLRWESNERVALFYFLVIQLCVWRRCGLVISALDFRSGGRWFEPGLCRRVVSLDKKLYFTLPLFTQAYKWVPAIIMLGGNLEMD